MDVVAALDTKTLPPRVFVGSRVDVVLLDADLADNAAFRLCQELHQRGEPPHVVFLSESAEPERIVLASLTDREREVLACLAEGIRRRDVARHLHMSPNTVRTHLQNLMGKLGVHTALEAVAITRSYLEQELSQRP